jgi:hypothetical protein
VSKLFYAMLTPYLWRQKGWNPVLLDTRMKYDTKCESQTIADDNGKACVNGKKYFFSAQMEKLSPAVLAAAYSGGCQDV